MTSRASFSAEFRLFYDALYMPVVIPTQYLPERTIYHHQVTGLCIDSFEVDGVALVPKPTYINFDEFDVDTMEASSDYHAYQVVMRPMEDKAAFSFFYLSWITADDYQLLELRVPTDAESIKMTYRPRYPRDHLGHSMTVLARRNNK